MHACSHMCWLLLVWYISECMVSITNINNGTKVPTHGYQNCNTYQIFILLVGFLKARESLHTQVIIWVTINQTILMPR